MNATTIKQVLHSKGDAIYGVEARQPLAVAIRRMAEHAIGSVLVFDDKTVVGIVTERDLARRVLFRSLDPETTPVEVVMTAPLAFVEPTHTVGHAMKVMSETHCRHLPVFADGVLLGVVSLGDLLRAATADLQTHIMYLESYIRGR
jgi:signal-transduction protein with cAMP-binding, CBS, and nucleotidyltransferase domain